MAVDFRTSQRAWGEMVREVPAGVLVVAAILAFIGVGTLIGGLYLIVVEAALEWAGWAMLLLAAPVSLYMAVQLVRRRRWAWRTIVFLLVLLLISSVLRAFVTPGVPAVAFLEIGIEVLLLLYLNRPHVRRAYAAA